MLNDLLKMTCCLFMVSNALKKISGNLCKAISVHFLLKYMEHIKVNSLWKQICTPKKFMALKQMVLLSSSRNWSVVKLCSSRVLKKFNLTNTSDFENCSDLHFPPISSFYETIL